MGYKMGVIQIMYFLFQEIRPSEPEQADTRIFDSSSKAGESENQKIFL